MSLDPWASGAVPGGDGAGARAEGYCCGDVTH